MAATHEICTLPCFREYDGISFPLCIRPAPNAHGDELLTDASKLAVWADSNNAEIELLLKKHGALLFRGFGGPTSTPETFAALVESGLRLPNFPYELGNAVRTSVVGERVFTANESPPSKPIPFHHELAQTPSYPTRILFYCETPADVGGETPLVLSTAVFEQLQKAHPKFIAKLESVGVKYSRVMTAHDRPESAIGRGWRATFRAELREDVEQKLRKKGYSWEWIGDGQDAMLRETSPVLEAVKDVGSGKKAFFNQVVAVWGGWRDEFNEPSMCVRAGDGEALDKDAMESAVRIMEENTVAIPWEKGDIMYIDNLQVQHSRNPFEGKRRVLASLAMNPPAVGNSVVEGEVQCESTTSTAVA